MKCLIQLLGLFGLLLFVGCASTAPKEDISIPVAKAEERWKAFNKRQIAPLYAAAKVDRERRIYNKVAKSEAPTWQKRRAGWNLVIAINEAQIPNVPQPPGRGSVQPNPFY